MIRQRVGEKFYGINLEYDVVRKIPAGAHPLVARFKELEDSYLELSEVHG